jgi:hypothetical protein
VDLGVDLRIAQLLRERTIGTTWPRIHQHSHDPPAELLNTATKKGPQKVHACQPSAQQLLNDLTQGLQPEEVSFGYFVPLVGLGNRAGTGEHRKRHIGVVPKKKHTIRHPPEHLSIGSWK